MRPPVLNPLFAPLSALPGHRPEARKGVRAAFRPRRRRAAAHHRSVVPPAERLRRPAQPAEALGGHARYGGDGCGDDRPASPAAAEPAARALQYRGERRHQHAHHHLFQRPPGLSAEAPARGRAALRLRRRDFIRRAPADAASRARGGREGLRVAAADRSGLSDDRGAASEPAPQGAGCGAASDSRSARMAGRGVAQAAGFSELCGSAAPGSSAGGAAGPRAAEQSVVAARL